MIEKGLSCLVALFVLCAATAPAAAAQYGYFGQNKIQYRHFEWRVLRGEHVDLYYYPEEEELGRVALAYAEESYDSLERRFNHAVVRRIPLIVYASHTDFEQTNIILGLGDPEYVAPGTNPLIAALNSGRALAELMPDVQQLSGSEVEWTSI